MNARSPRPARQRSIAPGLLHDDTIGAGRAAALGPACCCPAHPVVRVIMPATAARPHRTELLVCGHHYRVSRQAPHRIPHRGGGRRFPSSICAHRWAIGQAELTGAAVEAVIAWHYPIATGGYG